MMVVLEPDIHRYVPTGFVEAYEMAITPALWAKLPTEFTNA